MPTLLTSGDLDMSTSVRAQRAPGVPRTATLTLLAAPLMLLLACATPPAAVDSPAAPAPTQAAAPAPPTPLPIVPYDDAVQNAAHALLGRSPLPAEPPHPRYTIVIDPLIDGMTGMQNKATQAMGQRITQLIKERYPQYAVQPFTSANVQKGPLLLVDTFKNCEGLGRIAVMEGNGVVMLGKITEVQYD